METINEAAELFVKPGYGYGDGYGYGYGSGYGDGYGDGDGSGDGSGDGYGDGSGDGSGDGYGDGYGDGSGDGYGDGYGDGSGDGYGDGYGDGSGDGVKNFCGNTVYYIDRVPTIIKAVHGNVARGRILGKDLTLKPCYIAKGNGYFAHGETLQDALDALEEKILDHLPVEEKIAQFLDKFQPFTFYDAKDFYHWHHTLTGSCEMGRKEFARDHEIDLENDMMTPERFMDLTKDAYGGSVIRQLMQAWEEKYHVQAGKQ